MTDEQKLYALLKDFDPAVGERMEKYSKTVRITLIWETADIHTLKVPPSTRSFPTLQKKARKGS